MNRTNHSNDAESAGLGWKFVMIVGVITTIFFTFLYFAMSSEPDYMPSQQRQQHDTSHASVAPVVPQNTHAPASQQP